MSVTVAFASYDSFALTRLLHNSDSFLKGLVSFHCHVNTFCNYFLQGKVVTNVVSTCDPTPLYYMKLNIIKL